ADSYLADSPPGAALELPIDLEHVARGTTYQYLTLVHGHPIVNGRSAYLTPLLVFLGGGHSPFSDVEHMSGVIEMVRAAGVRYLVVHAGEFANDAIRDALMRMIDSDRRQVTDRRSLVHTDVFTLEATDGLRERTDYP